MRARAWAEVDLGAIAHNVGVLRREVAPAERAGRREGRRLRPRRRAGRRAPRSTPAPTVLGVAIADEGVALRDAGIDAPRARPVRAPAATSWPTCVAFGLEPTVYTRGGHRGGGQGGRPTTARAPAGAPQGRHRDAPGRRRRRRGASTSPTPSPPSRRLELASVFTHCAVADEPDDPYTGEQLRPVRRRARALADHGHRPPLRPRRQLRRRPAATRRPASTSCAAASPSTASPRPPASARRSPVVGELAPGAVAEGAGVARQGGRARGSGSATACATASTRDTVVATVPIGYADGVPRRLPRARRRGARRRPAAADRRRHHHGPAHGRLRPGRRRRRAAVGDEVVLLGEQGDERITAEEWAEPPRHHRLRDRVRHRPPGAAHLPTTGMLGPSAVITDVDGRAGRALDRPGGPHRVHRRAAPRRHRRRRREVRGGAPASRELAAARAGPHRRAARRRGAHRRLGVRAGGRRRRDALVRGARRRVPDRRRTGADRRRPSALFDLLEGDGSVRPGPERGLRRVRRRRRRRGRAGSGRRRHRLHRRASGRAASTPAPAASAAPVVRHEGVTVAALVAVNAVGDRRVAGERAGAGAARRRASRRPTRRRTRRSAWSLTDARLTKLECHLAPSRGHDGSPGRCDPDPHAGDGDACGRRHRAPIEHDAAGADRAVARGRTPSRRAVARRPRRAEARLEAVKTDWNPSCGAEFAKPYWRRAPVLRRRRAGAAPRCTRRPTRCSPACTSRPTPTPGC